MNIFSFVRSLFVKQPDQYLLELEADERKVRDIPTQEVGVARTALAANLRITGSVYHHASLLYCQDNPGSTFEDFDRLTYDKKSQYLSATAYSSGSSLPNGSRITIHYKK